MWRGLGEGYAGGVKRVVLLGLLLLAVGVADASAAKPCQYDGHVSAKEKQRAAKTYGRAWQDADWLWGVDGSLPPYAHFQRREPQPGKGGEVTWPGGGPALVTIGPVPIELACRGDGEALKLFLHEWAHIYQAQRVFQHQRVGMAEHSAEVFAHMGAAILWPRRSRRLSWGYPATPRESDDWYMSDQFHAPGPPWRDTYGIPPRELTESFKRHNW